MTRAVTASSPERGWLIAFEGTEGSGKSTHIRLARDVLRREGWTVEATAEPGGTPLGAEIRSLLLHRRDVVPAPLAELFLYLADRAQHVSEMIEPLLRAGTTVLIDRFSGSTIAYQAYGRGLDLQAVTRADEWARGGLYPDLTLFLDCPVRVGLQRAHGSDRFHEELEAFHERVRFGFAAQARHTPSWCTIDSTQPEAEVHRLVMSAIRALREAPRPPAS